MGVLSDFYIAEKSAAINYDTAQECLDEDRAQFKNITSLEISTLTAILEKKPWDAAMMDLFEYILFVNGGERLIQEIPTQVINLLSDLKPVTIQWAAEAWSRADEINCSPEDIRPVIEELVRLSTRARQAGRQLFLWNCV